MSREDAFTFMAEAHTGILTTLRRDGMPIALPVWFVVDRGTIYVSTPARTKKVARLRNDSRVSFLVESGMRWAELRAVQVNGRAAFVDAPDTLRMVGERLDAKYAGFRTARSSMPTATKDHYGGGRAVIGITPEGRIVSWDNAKLDLGGRGT